MKHHVTINKLKMIVKYTVCLKFQVYTTLLTNLLGTKDEYEDLTEVSGQVFEYEYPAK